MLASITTTPLIVRPVHRRARVDRTRVVARDASSLAPKKVHERTQEIASIAAKPAPVPVKKPLFADVSPVQAFGVGGFLAAAIIKGHIAAKSGSTLRKTRATLRYFDARGAAEVIRTIFAAANVDYEDYRYTFSMDGPKPQICEQHGVDKEAGMFDANLKRLPVLEVQGEMIGQSRAIERFVAKDLGLMGKGKIDEAKIDAICEHVRDLRDAYQKARGNPRGYCALRRVNAGLLRCGKGGGIVCRLPQSVRHSRQGRRKRGHSKMVRNATGEPILRRQKVLGIFAQKRFISSETYYSPRG